MQRQLVLRRGMDQVANRRHVVAAENTGEEIAEGERAIGDVELLHRLTEHRVELLQPGMVDRREQVVQDVVVEPRVAVEGLQQPRVDTVVRGGQYNVPATHTREGQATDNMSA